ncbi:hypothetical protein RclHR1_16940003 [Rhizophagus clarus]|uniref:Kinase-like domain-containing protein n=1 Tax=Rhizophagus clarus TaxID=94130 RepID=A0A2Z6QMW7_9GLOM|nr:hypothetical protein RclHR1_16940003 [Rhizophagus clarus]GET04596.1 kinase-like domain-containing protein [Rhizophagus clarus]
MHDTEDKNEWISWIEDVIEKNQLKYYEYNEFTNLQKIGTGGFGKVYRANWKNSEKHFALKSFFHLNNITVKKLFMSIIFCYLFNTKQHSDNILVHQNKIKLADFGLSERIEESSDLQSELFGAVPYIDPKIFSGEKNNNNKTTQEYSLNIKSDIYSIDVLLWEISSGRPPFDDEKYDIDLVLGICGGLRETKVPNTPDEYVKIYTECWDGDPDNRPTICQVVDWLKAMVTTTDLVTENLQLSSEEENIDSSLSANISELQGELSQLILNFYKMNTNEIDMIVSNSSTISNQFPFILTSLNHLSTDIVHHRNLKWFTGLSAYKYACFQQVRNLGLNLPMHIIHAMASKLWRNESYNIKQQFIDFA